MKIIEKKSVMNVSGMTCPHCEKTIINAVKKMDGVLFVTASFPKKQAEIIFDSAKTTEPEIREVIEKAGYKVKTTGGEAKKQPLSQVLPIFIIIISVYFIIRYTVGFDFFNLIPRIDQSISLAALFLVGLMTSVHCIAMCGGINLSQCVSGAEATAETGGKILKAGLKRPLLYNLGRVTSYTIIGGVIGGLGSVLSVNSTFKGAIMLGAGVFMILMSLSMLGWLPHWLVPRLPAKWAAKSAKAKSGRGPYVVGLFNGLMPCGPLQAMQLYALSTGSILMGALSMFLFSAGTVPLMLGSGIIFSMLKGKFTRSVSRVSAVLVMLIAVVMLYNATGFFGWSGILTAQAASNPGIQNGGISGSGGTTSAGTGGSSGTVSTKGDYTTVGAYTLANVKDGYQEVAVDISVNSYPAIVVQKGIPVKFNLRADRKNLNGCNGTILISKLNIAKSLQIGDNIVEFTPTQTGNIIFTCGMAMIRSTIVVVDDLQVYKGGASGAAAGQNGSPASTLPPAPNSGSGMPCCQAPVSN